LIVMNQAQVRYCGGATEEELSNGLPLLRQLTRYNIADAIIDHVDEFGTWVYRDNMQADTAGFSKIRDRETIGFFHQFALFTWRSVIQVIRSVWTLITLYGLTVVTAVILGVMYRKSYFQGPPAEDEIIQCPVHFYDKCVENVQDDYPAQGSFIGLALGLAAAAASLFTFGGLEKLVFWRESSTGQYDLAYFLSKMVAELPNLMLSPLLFTFIYALMTTPTMSTLNLWLITFGIFYSTSGAAHFISILTHHSRALIYCVIYVAIVSIICGANPTLPTLYNVFGDQFGHFITDISYCRWAVEAFYLSVVMSYQGIYQIHYGLDALDYSVDDLPKALAIPFVTGFVWRIGAAIAILVAHLDKRK